ncbi:uncharacterized protein F4807DRAFT_463303 [Annulohypoxylon truncatum]|uniref:uncharacterized protein n=1 Tax=Annulohypoxylon truncatum TaxID=327061 RepID=UPI0020077A6E|nr:uncharacterized protein F4807DRAFT_463303 [Annulohypoxylon truncatum]KAI1206904.1 hypothetical protein F4807DRAFT_463303 [Annulohypoxylon truncatum]
MVSWDNQLSICSEIDGDVRLFPEKKKISQRCQWNTNESKSKISALKAIPSAEIMNKDIEVLNATVSGLKDDITRHTSDLIETRSCLLSETAEVDYLKSTGATLNEQLELTKAKENKAVEFTNQLQHSPHNQQPKATSSPYNGCQHSTEAMATTKVDSVINTGSFDHEKIQEPVASTVGQLDRNDTPINERSDMPTTIEELDGNAACQGHKWREGKQALACG